jgi:hypothetical protein
LQTEEASTTSGSSSSCRQRPILQLGFAAVIAILWTSPSRASIRNFDIGSLSGFTTNGNGNRHGRSPLRSQTTNQRGCDGEINDLAWRGGVADIARACRPGVGAARHYQSRQVCPILSKRKLPELRARKPLHELWLAASRVSSLWWPSPSPPPLTPGERARPAPPSAKNSRN